MRPKGTKDSVPRSPSVPRTCATCGAVFFATPSRIRKGRGRFCSKPCYDQKRCTFPEIIWSRGQRMPNGCLEWTGYRDSKGYGWLGIEGGYREVSHLAWEITYGPIPEGLYMLHHCDNPPCFEPTHLYPGTQFDNMRDMVRRSRHWVQRFPERVRRGEEAAMSRLTQQQVRVIRQRYAAGDISQHALGREYGVHYGTIGAIVRRETWKHCE